ncbi:hypothetical protein [Nocardioides marmotae]|uniref:hypothetical protein n=1 Tax=Nocardioides marmotae TaxID=2663857 RepID=UPI0012B516CE|nr:hypothetical protein [Nocardioides marmotae]MBC9734618.1 hypothetical protein [Nocardioides marmotae]MTB85720.1 hypothetical protein [Nocardioides marmotae]
MSGRGLLAAALGGLLSAGLTALPAPAAPATDPVWTSPQVVAREARSPAVAVNAAGVAVVAWWCDHSLCVRRRSPAGALGRTARIPTTNVVSFRVAVDRHGTATLLYTAPGEDSSVLLAQRLRADGPVGDPVVVEEDAAPVALHVSRTGDVAVQVQREARRWLRVLAADGSVDPEVPLGEESVVEPAADGGFRVLDRERSGRVSLREVVDGSVTTTLTVGTSEVPADLAVRTDGTAVVAWWEGRRAERRLRTRHVGPSGDVSPVRALTGLVAGGRHLELSALPDGRVLAAFRSRAGVRGGVVPARPGPWMRLAPAVLSGDDQHVAVARDRVVLVSLVDTWMDHHVSARAWDGRRVSRSQRIIEAPGYDNDCGSSDLTVASAGGHVLVANRRSHSCRPRHDKVVLTYRR